jgi:hypothetical protein
MVTDPLNIAARAERTLGPDKINVKQSILLGRAIYHLSVTVFPYQSISKYLAPPRLFRGTISIRIRQVEITIVTKIEMYI